MSNRDFVSLKLILILFIIGLVLPMVLTEVIALFQNYNRIEESPNNSTFVFSQHSYWSPSFSTTLILMFKKMIHII